MSAEDIEYMGDYKEFPTKESALDWLDNYLSLDERNNLIKALEQESSEYAVDREQVNDILGHCIHSQEDYYLVIKIPKEAYEQIIEEGEMDYLEIMTAIENGIPFQEIFDSENSEIKNEVKDLSKRVETLEKQMKEDKEEQLKKLKAELDFAKFRCAL